MRFVAASFLAASLALLGACAKPDSTSTEPQPTSKPESLSCVAVDSTNDGMNAACDFNCNTEPYNCPDELCTCVEVSDEPAPAPSDDSNDDASDDADSDDGAADSATTAVVCHRPPGHPENAHTITVGVAAVDAHLRHGDTLGACGGDDAADDDSDSDSDAQDDAGDDADSTDDGATDDDADTDSGDDTNATDGSSSDPAGA